jgi:hypothetical protein
MEYNDVSSPLVSHNVSNVCLTGYRFNVELNTPNQSLRHGLVCFNCLFKNTQKGQTVSQNLL